MSRRYSIGDTVYYAGEQGMRGTAGVITDKGATMSNYVVDFGPAMGVRTINQCYFEPSKPPAAAIYKGIVESVQHLSPTTKNPNPKDSIGSSKLPIHLWPGVATAYGCLGLLDGAAKYGRGNYRTSEVRFSIYYDAAMRHMFKLMAGEDKDKDSGLPHEAHILACMAIIVDARAAGTLLDDRDAASGFNDVLADLTAHVPRLTALHADKNPRHYTIKDNDAKQTRKPD